MDQDTADSLNGNVMARGFKNLEEDHNQYKLMMAEFKRDSMQNMPRSTKNRVNRNNENMPLQTNVAVNKDEKPIQPLTRDFEQVVEEGLNE